MSDNYHITSKEFREFQLNLESMNKENINKLKKSCTKLMRDYQDHSKIRIEQDNRKNIHQPDDKARHNEHRH